MLTYIERQMEVNAKLPQFGISQDDNKSAFDKSVVQLREQLHQYQWNEHVPKC